MFQAAAHENLKRDLLASLCRETFPGCRCVDPFVLALSLQPADVPAGQSALCFLSHHTCLFFLHPDYLLTFLFTPHQAKWLLMNSSGLLPPCHIDSPPVRFLHSSPLFSGVIYSERFLLTLRGASPLLQSASLSLSPSIHHSTSFKQGRTILWELKLEKVILHRKSKKKSLNKPWNHKNIC